MHKLMTVLIALAIMATACSADGTSVEAGVVLAETANEVVTDAPDDAAEDNETETDAEAETDDETMDAPDTQSDAPAEVEAEAVVQASIDPNGCAFDSDLTPELVEVVQIPGEGRGDNPSSLENPLNAGFPTPLVDLDAIRSGGPPPDGIPPIDRPVFQTATSVDWIKCNEPVLSLEIDGEARAYPVQVMTWHELVNDTFGDLPVAVSYCPLCNSALAYKRDLGDRIVTFGTSGKLFNSSLVMYDRETESMWTHFNGAAVVGTLTGTQLELLPMQTTSWASFLESHPDGLVLTRDTGYVRSYGVNPYAGYDDVNTSPFLFDGDSDPRLAAKERVVGIRRGGDNAALVLEDLASAGVVATEVGGETLTIWHLPGTATALEENAIADGRDIGAVGVYIPEVDLQVLTFSRSSDGSFVDDQTGSSWNIQGKATAGALEGKQLAPVEHLDTFWFALAAFEPDTRIIG